MNKSSVWMSGTWRSLQVTSLLQLSYYTQNHQNQLAKLEATWKNRHSPSYLILWRDLWHYKGSQFPSLSHMKVIILNIYIMPTLNTSRSADAGEVSWDTLQNESSELTCFILIQLSHTLRAGPQRPDSWIHKRGARPVWRTRSKHQEKWDKNWDLRQQHPAALHTFFGRRQTMQHKRAGSWPPYAWQTWGGEEEGGENMKLWCLRK